MRIVSYFVSFIALTLFLNIIISFASPSYKSFLKDTKGRFFKIEEIRSVDLKPKTDYNEKIIESIEKLNENISKIDINNNKKEIIEESGMTNIGALADTGTVAIDELEKIPASIRIKLEKISLKKIENRGIYDINKLDKDVYYTSYYDETNKILVYVFESNYGIMMDHFRTDKTYKINEANNFFGYGFYLNPIKKDDKVRFVIQIEGKSIGFEVNKGNYELLKKILLK
ncbi:MAG: hypothetical protein PHS92_01010 [Candidatus Gracilibacteria bacterium]|nr:hypothetical protein [Candidatus Gracilibacteria bacterium]